MSGGYHAGPHTVYRLFDSDGDLLYVGASLNPDARVATHRRKMWGIFAVAVTKEVHPDWWTARQAETEAIRSENPRHNRCRMTTRSQFERDVVLPKVAGFPAPLPSALPSERENNAGVAS